MKRLSILIALILCVTIGGVYATWLYPSDSTNEITQPVTNVMAEVEPTGAYGTFSTVTNTLKLVVDQKSTTEFVTDLKYEGKLVIKFFPHDNISSAQLTAVKTAKVTVSVSDLELAIYNGEAIWALAADPTFNLNENNWVTESDGTLTYEINCSDLEDYIFLEKDFTLENIDDYNEFLAVQKHAVFRIKVTAKPVVTA